MQSSMQYTFETSTFN